MPLFYQQDMHEIGRIGIWRIEEGEAFFLDRVPLQREITHPHKRLQHLAGRFLLQALYPDFPYDLIRIADTRKPYLDNEAYHFSISHCGDYAAAFVSPFIRVELDWYDRECGHFETRFPEAGPLGLANLLWSAKETVYKWYGEGGIDFSEMIRTEGFTNPDTLQVRFTRGRGQALSLGFRQWGQLCLSWVYGDHTG
jgi:phosphopantetheinyl transferase